MPISARTKKLNADRAETLKSPGMLDQLNNALADHNLSRRSPMMGRGGFADVYVIPNNKILRVEMSGSFHKYGVHKMDTLRAIKGKPHLEGIIPRLYDVRLYKVPDGYSKWVMTSVWEKLTIVKWADWRKVYDNARDLTAHLIDMASKLVKEGVIHTDMSTNNMVLTPHGARFIDLDEACVDGGYYCTISPGVTYGFTGPEFALYGMGAINGKRKQALLRFLTDEYGTTTQPREAARNKQSLEANMIYGLGATIYHILTGKLPEHGVDLSTMGDIRPMLHDMMHALPDHRHLPKIRLRGPRSQSRGSRSRSRGSRSRSRSQSRYRQSRLRGSRSRSQGSSITLNVNCVAMKRDGMECTRTAKINNCCTQHAKIGKCSKEG